MFDSAELRLLSWNSDGVRLKIHELLDLAVSVLSVDIIGICETRLTPNSMLVTPGFTCYRQDKHLTGRGQGVAILVRNNLNHSVVTLPETKNMEVVGITVKISGIDHIVLSIYQSPNLPLLRSDLELMFGLGSHVVIMGDFNANHSHWLSSYTNTRGRTLFKDMLESDYVIHSPSLPTQVNYCPNRKPTRPDLVLSLNVGCISDVETIIALSSNHYPIFFTIGGFPSRKVKTQFFKFHCANWNKYRSHLNKNITLSSKTFNTNEEIDKAIGHLQQTIIDARDSSIPSTTAGFSDTPTKLPRYIKKIIRYKNYLRRIEQKLPSGYLRRLNRSNINTLQALINSNIRNHLDNVWNAKLAKVDNPSQDIWRVTKSLKPRSANIPPLKLSDGSLTTTEVEQCNALAEAFYKNMSLTSNWVCDSELEVSKSMSVINNYNFASGLIKPVRPFEIRKTLTRLKSRKSPSHDAIHNALLKNLPQKAIVYITKIFNGCFVLGYFPKIWKNAKIIPLKKPGKDNTSPTNYRPVSLLPAIGKMFESIIYSRLLHATGQFLIQEQFGFRATHSTTQQLARVCEHISHHLNLKQSTGMFLLDIEKAFDTVWHEGLLHKLLNLDVPMPLIKLIQSYLTDRKFQVHIGNTISSPQSIPAGVPQGSIVGPYLFLIFVNDIPIQPRTKLACFADDTASYTSSDDTDLIIGRLQYSIELLQDYFKKWKLKINEDKTEAIFFSRARQPPTRTLKIAGHKVPWKTSVRYLGVRMDNRLNWSKHIADLRLKGAQALGALNPIMNRKSRLSSGTKLRIYTTLVRPCITYACPVWSGTCLSNHHLLQVIQNKAVKTSYKTKFKTNLQRLHKTIKLPLLFNYIFKISLKFYNKNKINTNNPLITNLCSSTVDKLPYIDRYGTYRLPHHYLLFPPTEVRAPSDLTPESLNAVPASVTNMQERGRQGGSVR